MLTDPLTVLTLLLSILQSANADNAPLCNEPNSPCVISCTDSYSCYAMDITASLSTSILFNCSGDHSCEHLNVIASSSDNDGHRNFDEHTNFTILCAGDNSCNDAVFDISGEYSLSLNCLHPNSCVDTSVNVRTSHNERSSDVQIDFVDSCSSFLSILCFDEASQCSLYCENKYVEIAADAFRVRTIDDADTCIEQQFTHSCPDDEGELEHTHARCPKNYGVVTTMMTETIWNVRQLTNADLSDFCTHSPYYGEFERRITTMQPSYAMAQNEGQGLRTMSVVVAIGCVCVVLSIFVAITIYLFRRARRVHRKQFISRRPPFYYLWGPFACDFLIFIAFYWWLIKGVVFESSANAYCSSNYPVDEFSQFRTTCDTDDICQLDKDDGTYECTSAFTDYYIARWVILSIFSVVELCRLCHAIDPTYYFGDQCLCACVICCCQCPNTPKHEFWERPFWHVFAEPFWDRRLWMRCSDKKEDDDGLPCCWSFDTLLRYGIHILFACLHYGLHSPLLPNSDATVQWYDVWPVLALVVLKTCLHICYFCGKAYDPEEEWPHETREILVDRLAHSSIAAVVESFLPLYHDAEKCPAELLVVEIRTQGQRRKINDKYEQFD